MAVPAPNPGSDPATARCRKSSPSSPARRRFLGGLRTPGMHCRRERTQLPHGNSLLHRIFLVWQVTQATPLRSNAVARNGSDMVSRDDRDGADTAGALSAGDARNSRVEMGERREFIRVHDLTVQQMPSRPAAHRRVQSRGWERALVRCRVSLSAEISVFFAARHVRDVVACPDTEDPTSTRMRG